eukprot:273834-Chlamydomonas_euryale.AAC.5
MDDGPCDAYTSTLRRTGGCSMVHAVGVQAVATQQVVADFRLEARIRARLFPHRHPPERLRWWDLDSRGVQVVGMVGVLATCTQLCMPECMHE